MKRKKVNILRFHHTRDKNFTRQEYRFNRAINYQSLPPKREPILCSLPLHPLVMSRYPSRSLVSIVATGSDNQRRRFCLNMEVCLLAFPHAIPPSSPFYRQLYPILCLEYFPGPISALSRLVSPCLRPHVCASANYPSPFNTTSLSLPPSYPER